MSNHSKFLFSVKYLPKMQSLIAQRLAFVAVGALYPLGFSPFDFWPVAFISITLLINEIIVNCREQSGAPANEISKQERASLSLFSMGLYWGLGAFGIGVSWVYVSIHEFGHAPVIGAVAISFLFVLTLSLMKAGGIYLIGKMSKWFGSDMLLLIIPFAWVISEFVQATLFSGFPWLFVGYSQIDGPLWMLSTWLGVYGVSWFVIAISSCLVILWHFYLSTKDVSIKRTILSRYALVLLVLVSVPILSFLAPQAIIQQDKKSISVALVQPNIAQEKKWDRRYFSQIIDVLYQQSREHWDVDLLVWPEGAIPAYQHQVKDIIADLEQRAESSNTDLLLGLPIYYPENETSYSSFISVGKHPQTYHKQVLVPFGEYVPLGDLLRGLIEFFDLPMSSFSPATSLQQAMEFKDYQVITAICYEITYPDIVHDLIAKADANSDKAKLLVTVSNDAWFGSSFGPHQHMQIARMRALESGIPLIRSTNNGITAIVDARGTLIKKLDQHTQGTLSYQVPLSSYQTLYRRFGLLGIYGLLAISLVVFAIRWFTQNKELKDES